MDNKSNKKINYFIEKEIRPIASYIRKYDREGKGWYQWSKMDRALFYESITFYIFDNSFINKEKNETSRLVN